MSCKTGYEGGGGLNRKSSTHLYPPPRTTTRFSQDPAIEWCKTSFVSRVKEIRGSTGANGSRSGVAVDYWRTTRVSAEQVRVNCSKIAGRHFIHVCFFSAYGSLDFEIVKLRHIERITTFDFLSARFQLLLLSFFFNLRRIKINVFFVYW